jgi:hypothetical protein
VSNLNPEIYAKIEAWRNRRIEGEHPYLYLDGIVMKRSWAGEVRRDNQDGNSPTTSRRGKMHDRKGFVFPKHFIQFVAITNVTYLKRTPFDKFSVTI